MTVVCAVLAFWVASPDNGEWNLVVTATAIALVFGLLTSMGMLFGILMGAGFIVVSLLTFIEPDPSGLGPPEITIPIQLIVAAIPMVLGGMVGGKLRSWLGRPR